MNSAVSLVEMGSDTDSTSKIAQGDVSSGSNLVPPRILGWVLPSQYMLATFTKGPSRYDVALMSLLEKRSTELGPSFPIGLEPGYMLMEKWVLWGITFMFVSSAEYAHTLYGQSPTFPFHACEMVFI